MGRETLELHHGKHHNAYVTTLNGLVEGTDMANKTLDEVVVEGFKAGNQGLVNQAGQHWNHSLFWPIMKKDAGAPAGELKRRIEHDFGSIDKMKETFKTAAVGQFGSGWAWLVLDGDKLDVMKTPNGENPLMHGKKALMGIDVWEHAYYLDYRNRRPDYVQAWLDHLVNWEAVEKRLG
jgi:Fe-Mn family superoxide dismutase